jgi:hypothetical protein
MRKLAADGKYMKTKFVVFLLGLLIEIVPVDSPNTDVSAAIPAKARQT